MQESGTPLFRPPSAPAPAPPQEQDGTLFPVPPASAEPPPPSPVPEPGEDAAQESTDGPTQERGEDQDSPPAPHTSPTPVSDTWRIDLYRGGRPRGPYDHDLTRTGTLTHLLTPLAPWLEEYQATRPASGVWARIVPATAHPWDVAPLPPGPRHLGTGYLQVRSQALPPAEPAPPVESPRPAAAAPAADLPPVPPPGSTTGRSQLSSGEAARMLEISANAFKRLATEVGLVCMRTPRGHRRYDQAQVRALAAVRARPIEDYYDLDQTADRFNVTTKTLQRCVIEGAVPEHHRKVGQHKYWLREVIDALVDNIHASVDEAR
ncbi:MerR family transcriptional regulator [Nocardiopsis sp. NPDC006198]|uniref:MerR family transcriptional regulator n=1 Tax=Nocardiopsis sp. NPDC006198 TaxID=3154472 RepID=UPI0033ABAF9A